MRLIHLRMTHTATETHGKHTTPPRGGELTRPCLRSRVQLPLCATQSHTLPTDMHVCAAQCHHHPPQPEKPTFTHVPAVELHSSHSARALISFIRHRLSHWRSTFKSRHIQLRSTGAPLNKMTPTKQTNTVSFAQPSGMPRV